MGTGNASNLERSKIGLAAESLSNRILVDSYRAHVPTPNPNDTPVKMNTIGAYVQVPEKVIFIFVQQIRTAHLELDLRQLICVGSATSYPGL